jgi:hypothetical protein
MRGVRRYNNSISQMKAEVFIINSEYSSAINNQDIILKWRRFLCKFFPCIKGQKSHISCKFFKNCFTYYSIGQIFNERNHSMNFRFLRFNKFIRIFHCVFIIVIFLLCHCCFFFKEGVNKCQ